MCTIILRRAMKFALIIVLINIRLAWCLVLDARARREQVLAIKSSSDLPDHPAICELLNNLIYISLDRMGTSDVFPIPEEVNLNFADMGSSGQFAPWWFDQYSDEEIDPQKTHPNSSALTLRRQFKAWAGELFPGSEADTEKIEHTSLVRLQLRKSQQQQWMRPANIGYGLTYAFPILVAGLLAKPQQTLIIDSPEAHLHPMGQSRIGYFLGVVAASGTQVILETHSDHVLNGIRLAAAKQAIHHEQVAVHFFGDGQDGHSILSPLMNQRGDLSEWPDGFFDQSDKDLAALMGWDN